MKNRLRHSLVTTCLAFALALVLGATSVSGLQAPGPADSLNILPERERARVMDEWLKWRLENILPDLMRREGIDLWLVIVNESDPGPVYFTLMPAATLYVVRTACLMFHDRGKELGVERLTAGSSRLGDWCRSTWLDKKNKRQFENLADVVRKLNPKKIGILTSPIWYFGDDLTAGLKDKLVAALGPELSKRLVSADRLAVGWLETRSPQELSVYRHVCGITHDLIREFFSNRVIVPMSRPPTTSSGGFASGSVTWASTPGSTPSSPSSGARPTPRNSRRNGVIRRGDLLHCDVGLKYLGLHSDMQWSAYVLKPGETDAPEGLRSTPWPGPTAWPRSSCRNSGKGARGTRSSTKPCGKRRRRACGP